MSNLAFDTHSAVKRLIISGMPDKQAESIVETLRESREFDVSHLATKMDLKDVKVALDRKIDGVKSELKADINALDKKIDGVKVALDRKIDGVKSELKTDIAGLKVDIAGVQVNTIKWIIPLLLGQTALIAALVKLLQQ